MQCFLHLSHVTAGDRDGFTTMHHEQLHGASARDNLLHLSEIDKEGTVATHNHRVGLQRVFHLLGGGS